MVKENMVSVLRKENEVYRWRRSTGDPGIVIQVFSTF